MAIDKISDPMFCCGCGACMNICPKYAISMESNENGFRYPKVDLEKCIDCGLCLQVCSYTKNKTPASRKKAFAAAGVDTDPMQSASGGLFASFAKHILSAGGVVYGCAMLQENNTLHPKHIRVDKESDLPLLKGSKYVQSDIGMAYREVRDDLKSERPVLFTGTPCQVEGLRGFLRKDYDNLYTIDIICHGVPSIQMFRDYLLFVEGKEKKKVVDYKFRDKSGGWKLHGKMVLEAPDGKRETVFFEPEQSSYYQMFLNSYTYRENCYQCPYAGDHRPGDITIGDYWCIDLVHPELLVENAGPFDEKKGISCLIINNEQGQRLVEAFGSGIEKRESSFENAARYNGQLKHPSVLKPEREIALRKYAKGYDVLDRWYRRKLFPIKVKRTIRAAVPRTVKDWMKSIVKR